MNVYEAIRSRASVRNFAQGPLDEAKLLRVLEAGRLAPSARNRQPWKFVVVRDAALRKKLALEVCEQPWIAKAGAIVAVVAAAEDYVMYCGIPANPVDCAIAIDHMALAAVEEGLGTCWVGHFSQEAAQALLGVPPEYKIIELLTVGVPASPVVASAKSRKSLQEVVCWEKFS